jgi:hypothetical protein
MLTVKNDTYLPSTTTSPFSRLPSHALFLAPTVAGAPLPPCCCRHRRLLPWPHRHGPPCAELGSPAGAHGPPGAPPPLHRRHASSGRHRPFPQRPLFSNHDQGPRSWISRKEGAFLRSLWLKWIVSHSAVFLFLLWINGWILHNSS